MTHTIPIVLLLAHSVTPLFCYTRPQTAETTGAEKRIRLWSAPSGGVRGELSHLNATSLWFQLYVNTVTTSGM